MPSPSLADLVHEHARELTRRVLAAAPGAVRTVFAGGSLARGQIAGFDDDGVAEIYSDVDLYVVLAEGTDGETLRGVIRSATSGAAPPAGTRMMATPDVGVYSFADLLAQPARPGTVALAREHVLLHGDDAIFPLLAESIGTTIDPAEGLYLIENRLIELAGADPPGSPASVGRFRRVRLLKTIMDVGAATLVGLGCYRTRGEERVEMLRRLAAEPGSGVSPGDADLVAWAHRERSDLNRSLAAANPPEAELETRVVDCALNRWKNLAASLEDTDTNDWVTLILNRCRIGDYGNNFKEFLALRTRQGHPRRSALWAGMHLARYAPVETLRLAALMRHVSARLDPAGDGHRSLASVEAFIDRLTASGGFQEGPLDTRALAMFRAIQ